MSEERLDAETEGLIHALIVGVGRDAMRDGGFNYRPAEDALRRQIRLLVMEARQAGEESVYKTTGNMVKRS